MASKERIGKTLSSYFLMKTDETLIKGCAKRLVGKVKEKGPVSWPLKTLQLEEPDVLNPLFN